MTRRQSPRLAAAFAALAVLALAGCELTVPASDPTPPEVSMTVAGLGTAITVDAASGPVSRNAPAGATVVILASGRDPEGVKNITISGSGRVSCSSGDLGQLSFLHYAANNPEDASVGVGDTAVDQRLTSIEINVDGWTALCRGDFQFNSAGASFVATAENFHGGTASTPPFSLNHP